MLEPRVPEWREDRDARAALERVEREPWVDLIYRQPDGVRFRLSDEWLEATGSA